MDWLRRNRRRLAVGGGVLGGLYIVGRWHYKKPKKVFCLSALSLG